MNRNDFKNLVEHLCFDDNDVIFLIQNNMSTNIYEYTPLEIKYIKEQVRLRNIQSNSF